LVFSIEYPSTPQERSFGIKDLAATFTKSLRIKESL
jgi:hypothetical protein